MHTDDTVTRMTSVPVAMMPVVNRMTNTHL